MTPRRDLPTDEEMRRWSIESPEDGPEEPVDSEPMTPEEFARHKAWLAERFEADKRDASGVGPRMSQEQIRAAGVRIDLPTEAASGDPKDIAYADGSTLSERLDARYEARQAAKQQREQPPEDTGTPPPEEGEEEGGGSGT